jgi:predicted nucleic acid-binding protein
MESLEYHDFAGNKIALQAAQNSRILQKNGITVRKTIDVIIATFCIENGFALLHNDRDFDPKEELLGLSVIR